MKLSILMPVYNERTVVERCLSLVLAAPLPESMDREIVIVDDCSTDGTWDILQRLAARFREIRLYRHARNRGKGAARAHRDRKSLRRFRPDSGRRPRIRPLRVPAPAAARCSMDTPTPSSGPATWPASKPAYCPSGTP